MKIWRWLFFDFVDPRIELTFRERYRIAREAMINSAGDPAGCLIMFLALALVVALSILGYLWYGFWVLVVAVGLGPSVIMYFVLAAPALWGGRHMIPHIARQLHKRGYDVCFNCGYWLVGLDESSTHCPECGEERRTLPLARAMHERKHHEHDSQSENH